jgi:hypothetical protein
MPCYRTSCLPDGSTRWQLSGAAKRRSQWPNGQDVEEVTYKSTGLKAEDLLSSFRNSYNPRVVVTVDMIATGHRYSATRDCDVHAVRNLASLSRGGVRFAG